MPRFLLAITAFTTLALVMDARADVLCSKGGAVHIRTVCKKGEVAVALSDLGAHAAVWKDSAGTFLGIAAGADVLIGDSAGNSVSVATDGGGNLGAPATTSIYNSNDCSGPALFGSSAALVPADSVVRGTTVYYPIAGTTTFARDDSSLHTDPSYTSQAACSAALADSVFVPPSGCCTLDPGTPLFALPSLSLDLSALVPPFHIEVR